MKNRFRRDMKVHTNNSPMWNILDDFYTKFLETQNTPELIPKKIHQIWLGNMPPKHKKLISKIKDNHIGWEYKLWGEKDLKDYPMVNKNLFNKTKNLGAKSDIARYEILYNEGGIYLDSDFEMVNSFDKLLKMEFFTGVGHSKKPMVYNGLIGCTQRNEMMKILIENLSPSKKRSVSHHAIMQHSGPFYFTKLFFEYLRENTDKKLVVLPGAYFYPFPALRRNEIDHTKPNFNKLINSYNTEDTICIHLWYNAWQ